ncbi:MAG: 3-hydroxyacyl-ACP dehydratase FabZ [Candidatus Omnitrophota bacterium]|nr:3-hydroxyacyl-ACP dehydratase FabZ [Candidatus Omnitrophota bacterium]
MLNIEEIKKILPQRFPFLMIDRVIELKENEKLVAIKNVSINEHFFEGHFPNEKVMPGVLIIEAMAQAGIVLYHYSKKPKLDSIYFLGKVEARFFKPVVPGDQLRLELTPAKFLSTAGIFNATAYVKDVKVAEAQIAFGVKSP